MEKWKDIKGYEELYQVSNLGNVKSLERKVKCKGGALRTVNKKLLKLYLDGKGYLQVKLNKKGNYKSFNTHKLVAMSFLGHTPCGHKIVVDHIDNNPLNNNVENLQLITNRENLSKDKKGGTSKYVGVFYNGRGVKRWRANISLGKKTINLGSFNSEERASIAYNFALTQLDKLKEYNLTR
jgi:hypothetical protein